jgi:hypothetical protein
MRFFIFPLLSPGDSERWAEVDGINLGGFFYDYITSRAGERIGVRYFVDRNISIQDHLVFSEFRSDPRFKFNLKNGYIDILFKAESSELYDDNLIDILVAQDFGGDHVLESNGRHGIMFEINDI